MNAIEATTSAKKGGSDFECVIDAWTEYAATLAVEARTAQKQMERVLCLVNSEYAWGRADGLRQALRILGGRTESMNENESTTPSKSVPCAIERAAIDWEAKAKGILPWYNEEVAYCTGFAAGLREALRILAREN